MVPALARLLFRGRSMALVRIEAIETGRIEKVGI
jgi:hypothetical protein